MRLYVPSGGTWTPASEPLDDKRGIIVERTYTYLVMLAERAHGCKSDITKGTASLLPSEVMEQKHVEETLRCSYAHRKSKASSSAGYRSH
jgi:hypothetical protein